MNSYAWSSWGTAAEVTALLAALVIVARACDRLPQRVALRCAWLLLPIAIAMMQWLAYAEPAGTRMLALVAGTLVAMKAVVLQAYRAGGAVPLTLPRWLLFLPWLGMNPRTVAMRRPGGADGGRTLRLCCRGLRNVIAGVVCVVVARSSTTVWAIPLLMVGLSLVVHFGLLTCAAAGLQALGFPARALFDAPLGSRSLRELWAQRWNRGFSEMTALAVHRPLASRVGRSRALLGSFLVSGLLHEVAISLPVGAGFGLPTLYFVLQGVMVLRERGEPGRLATLLRVALPLPLVFHPWFVRGTVMPLLG